MVGVVAVRIHRVAIAGEHPLAAEGVLRRGALSPVEGRGRGPAHQQIADLTDSGGLAVGALHACLVARNDLTRCAGPRATGKVRDGDVADLGRADAVEDLEAEARAPALEQRRGQRLTRGDAAAQRRTVVAL